METIFILLIFFGCLTTINGLSCLPCHLEVCEPPVCNRSGLVKDICGCCDVCAKEYNEPCDGVWGSLGTCDKNLTCDGDDEYSVGFDEGTCLYTECKAVVDVIIAVNGLESFGQRNSKIIREVIKQLIANIYKSFGACAHVQLLQYADKDEAGVTIADSTKFEIPFPLGECTNNMECVERRFNDMANMSGGTYTYYALRRVREVEFPKSVRVSQAKKIVIVITSSKADDGYYLKRWYRKARRDEIISFAVGVGGYRIENLRDIANGGKSDERVFTYRSATSLEHSVENLLPSAIWNATVDLNSPCTYPEIYRECRSHCKSTCDNPIPICALSCAPAGCECAAGYVYRSEDDLTCIRQEDCPDTKKCTFPEVHTDCALMCKPSCDDPTPACAEVCMLDQCVCADGYVRKSTEDDSCILKEECPGKTCPHPMVLSQCASACPETCETENNLNPISCTEQCILNECVCPQGMVLKSLTEKHCVDRELCQNTKKCTFPEVHTDCALMCKPSCDDPTPACAEVCMLDQCVCADGYVRKSSEDDSCILKEECPDTKKCTFPEVHTGCALMCKPTCDDPTPACSKACVLDQCVCADGYVRKSSENDSCILKEECPGFSKTCPFPKVYMECPPSCPTATCPEPNPGPCQWDECGKEKCVCPHGFVLSSESDKRCVRLDECPYSEKTKLTIAGTIVISIVVILLIIIVVYKTRINNNKYKNIVSYESEKKTLPMI